MLYNIGCVKNNPSFVYIYLFKNISHNNKVKYTFM